MNRAIGVGLMAVGVIGILLYGWLVFFSPWQVFILQLTAFVAAGRRLRHTGLGRIRPSHHTPTKTHRGNRKRGTEGPGRNRKDHTTQPLAADATRYKARSAAAPVSTPQRRRDENPQVSPRPRQLAAAVKPSAGRGVAAAKSKTTSRTTLAATRANTAPTSVETKKPKPRREVRRRISKRDGNLRTSHLKRYSHHHLWSQCPSAPPQTRPSAPTPSAQRHTSPQTLPKLPHKPKPDGEPVDTPQRPLHPPTQQNKNHQRTPQAPPPPPPSTPADQDASPETRPATQPPPHKPQA